MIMKGSVLRCYLVLCLSALVVFDHSAKAWVEDPKWAEPHDDKYKKNVAKLQKLLTREGRQFAHDMAVRSRQLDVENASNKNNSNRIRRREESQQPKEQQERDLKISSSVNDLNVLVVLMQWKNHPDRNTAIPRESYDKMFNGQGRDPDTHPGGSVKEYFEAMSYGELTINFEVTDWVMTDFTEQQATANGSQGRSQELQEAFKSVLEFLDDDFTVFSNFDNDFDRKLDVTVFLHSGYEGGLGNNDCETGAKPMQRVASHARTDSDESDWVSVGGYRLGAYAVAPAFRGTCDLEIGRIGTIVHELVHPFGIPDLYDMEGGYGTGRLGGIDRFGVMANQNGNSGGDLSWPGHMSAWTKVQLGWVNPTVIETDGVYEIKPVAQDPEIYKISKGFEDKEYLLLENRQKIEGDFDEKFMDPGGVLIYHIDENVWDIFDNGGNTGNFPRGGPFQSGWPGNGKHYPVALLQADGLYELEQGINGGTSDDIWNKPSQVLGPGNGEKVASTANYPNTDSYAFGVIKPTGITIKNFQQKGDLTMTFQVCGFSGGDCPDISTPITTDPTKSPTKSPTESPIEKLENGSCEKAVEAFRPDDSPKGISNITIGTNGTTCYGEEGIGVWYKVEAGTVPDSENTVQANTCFSETNAVSKISVFKGGDCGTLECVETKQMGCKNKHLGHIVYWEVEKDEDYHLFVHSVPESNNALAFDTLGDGSVFLDVFNFAPMKNDNCISATTITTDGKRVGGSTERATPDSTLLSSDTCGVESAGVWFKVNGTGSELRATTCHPGTSSPTQIHVFSGSCDSLSCISVESNNYAVCSDFDIATNSATVNWKAEEGVEYFILVGSRDGIGGVFELSVSEFTPAVNDQCPNAIGFDIPETKAVVSGSTEDATNDFPFGGFCGTPLDTAGVWYTIEGTGDGLSISTCGQNDYNSAISIFTGSDCGELECFTGIATRDPACDFNGVTAAWLSEKDETYYVYVHGSAQNSYGTFELEAEKFEVKIENEFCGEAMDARDGIYILGTTITAGYSAPTNVCGAEAVKPGLWYTFQGTGYPWYFSGCPLDDFDLSVSFFTGENCGALTCVSGSTYTLEECPPNNDPDVLGSGTPANFTSIESELGVTYYMVVHGQARADPETGEFTEGAGTFDFKLMSFAPPDPTDAPNDQGDGGGTSDDGGEDDSEDEKDENTDGDGNSETDSDLSKDGKKFNRKKLMWILIGVGAFLILMFCIPPCWINRKKLRNCFRRSNRDHVDDGSDDESDDEDADMEEAPFTDERLTRKSSKQESASSPQGGRKHKWQTLSFRAS